MLTTADLSQMQAVQDASMIDTCVIVTVTTTAGAYGGQQATTTESSPTRCGLSFNTARRMDAGRGPLAAALLPALAVPVAEAARIYVRGTVASWDNDPRFDRFEDQFQYRRSRIEPDSILCTEAQAIFRLNSKVGAKRAEIRAMYTAAGLEPPELSR